MIPSFAKLLTGDQVARIAGASMEILADTGLLVRNEKARKLFAKHGAKVDSHSQMVKLPRPVVEEFMAAVPPTFTFRGRDPRFDRTLPGEGPLFATASSAPNVIDPVSGEERRATSEDIARMAHLIDALPGYDVFSVATLADDAPPGLYSLSRFYPALKNCRKPIRASLLSPKEADEMVRLLGIIAGGEGAFWERPFITFGFCAVISPLTMDYDATEMLMYYAEKGIPNHSITVPNGGLSSPFTLAATTAQGNAEFLAATVLTQMTKPGTEVLYSVLPTMTDMRTGAYAAGAVETGMLDMAVAQMAAYHNVACGGYIGQTNSKISDAQAGYEKAMSSTMGVLAGFDFLQVGGLVDTLMAFDFGQAVIDNEIAMMLKRLTQGMEFSEENLALDIIKEVGPAGMFVDHPHTFERMKTATYLPQVADRTPRQTWKELGSTDIHDRGLWRAREILTANNDAVFSSAVDARIRATFDGLVAGDSLPPEGWTAPGSAPRRRQRTGRRRAPRR